VKIPPRFNLPRFPSVEVCLAATTWLVWYLISCIEVDIAASRKALELAVVNPRWQPTWRVFPWFLGLSGIVIAYVRLVDAEAVGLVRRVRQMTSLCAAAGAMKLLSLWDLPTYFLPFIGALWSPHCTWALGLCWLLFLHLPQVGKSTGKIHTPGHASLIALAIALPVYSAYAFYFCQVTLLHGDEGQYLRVTQSLLRDGDMDLANNLDDHHIAEFHNLRFDVHKASASPPGKVFSVHPIGLSVLLMPFYELGLDWWGNPRLACALALSAISAGCVSLCLLWLLRLGIRPWVAWLSSAILAGSAPLFSFSNQLFPDVPALFVLFAVLSATAHWQKPDGGYRSMGVAEPLWIGMLALLLATLPFLHARFAPIALAGGALLLLQTWRSAKRHLCGGILAAVALCGLYGIIAFNYAFSGDWMGPFRPGNAWEEGALQFSTWSVSLPGHWLHVRKGIVNSAPIFLLSLAGLVILARARDRRFALAVGIYGVSAMVNGLHTDWGFGFCYPARFLVTALPALILCLAIALEVIRHRIAGFFLVLMALAVGADGLLDTIAIPETGYDGYNLATRSINHFYPWHAHFYSASHSNAYFWDLLNWGLLGFGAIYLLIADRTQHRLLRAACPLALCMVLFLWGRTDVLGSRLKAAVLPDLANTDFARDGEPLPGMVRSTLVHRDVEHTGEQLEGRRFAAVAGKDPAGLLTSTYMPFLQPGRYRIFLPDLIADSQTGAVAGHLLFSARGTVPAVSSWERRATKPLNPMKAGDAREMSFSLQRPWLGYTHILFSGDGDLSVARINLDYRPGLPPTIYEPVHRFSDSTPGADAVGMAIVEPFVGLEPGTYLVRYELQGSVWSSWTERRPKPIGLAVFAGTGSGRKIAENQFESWFAQDRELLATAKRNESLRPVAESLQAPWWVSIPWLGRQAFELEFQLEQRSDVWFLAKYSGSGEVRTRAIELSRRRTF
jgi:hypothetical protein